MIRKTNYTARVLALLFIFFSSLINAATLNVSGGGILTGASGVDVNGTLYDVWFVDDSCENLYGGCDEASDFTFQTLADAKVAAQALLDQVFLDGVLGNFDSNPALTEGCGFWQICHTYIPYALGSSAGSVNVAAEYNIAAGYGSDSVANGFTALTKHVVYGDTGTYAVFAPAAVPVPAALWLMLSGLGVMGFVTKRQSN